MSLANGASRMTFCAAESAGLDGCTSTPPVSMDVATTFDGPRTNESDVTTFKVNRWGAVTSITNALNQTTTLERTKPEFPLLVTAVVQPTGFRTQATYTAKGQVETTTAINGLDDNRSATTTYTWHPTWDRVTDVRSPEGVTSHTEIDPVTSMPAWTEVGGRNDTRSTFAYTPNGTRQVASVTTVRNGTNAVQRIDYDALGNVSAQTTPLGFQSLIFRDAIGRDTLSKSHTDADRTASKMSRQRTRYDIVDRVLESWIIGAQTAHPDHLGVVPTIIVPADSVRVTTDYDEEGNPVAVVRTVTDRDLITTYQYDAAHRKRLEGSSSGRTDLYTYDAAGNTTAWQTGSASDAITMTYDAVNRVTRRIVPAVSHAAEGWATFCPKTWPSFNQDLCQSRGYVFPYFDAAAGVQIPADTSLFTYDVGGRMLTANNGDAQIARSYHLNGLPRSETQRIGSYVRDGSGGPGPPPPPQPTATESTFGTYDFTLGFRYDLDGRRTALVHNDNTILGCPSPCEQRYGYAAGTGLLDVVTDPFAGSYGFAYNGALQVSNTTAPGGASASYGYDLDGRLTGRFERTATISQIRNDALSYDALGKITRATTPRYGLGDQVMETWYSGLGHLAARRQTTGGGYPDSYESWVLDAMGNATKHRRATSTDRAIYTSAFDREQLKATTGSPWEDGNTPPRVDETMQDFDFDGNLRWVGVQTMAMDANGAKSGPEADRLARHYYGSDRKLRVFQEYTTDVNGPGGQKVRFEEYRYDALGRRVLLRSRASTCPTPSSGQRPECHVDRFVWDGDDILYERRGPGQDGATESASTDKYSGTVAYVHAGGIDQPLALYRQDQLMVLHTNWRGLYDLGTTVSGDTVQQRVQWLGNDALGYLSSTKYDSQKYWVGTLIEGKADASGLMYMRNRYYDPKTGRFTQEDPIGLAGGMNLYGFAGGDPVNYSDPFGLCVDGLSTTFCLYIVAASVATVATFAWQASRLTARSAPPVWQQGRTVSNGGRPSRATKDEVDADN